MGVSTNAILAFGFDLGDELPSALEPPDGEEFDFDNWIDEKASLVYPEGHAGIDSPEYSSYYEACQAARAACPVDLITHCSYDSPMRFLAIRGTDQTAHRGYPEAIETPAAPPPESIAAMRKFCEDNGIEWREPKWHIFSLWG